MLKNCPFPSDIRNIGIENLTDILKKGTKNRVGLKKAKTIYDAANNSICVPVGLEGARYRLNLIMRNIDNLQDEINKIEAIIERYLIGSGYSEYLLSIPGVGIVVAASFLAEIGDI